MQSTKRNISERIGNRLKGKILFWGITFAILFYVREAYAWGVGMHMMHGATLLENLHWLTGPLAETIRIFPRDFLYGCISADIFIGKGSKYHADHCHNWSVGRRLLQEAPEPRLEAFACGYLAHLAADIIAHNVYVPNQLYLTASTTKWGHIYWEFRAEEYADRRYWREVLRVMEVPHDLNDRFVQEVVKKELISFDMKKRLFTQVVKLYELGRRREATSLVSRNSRWDISQEQVVLLNRRCLGLIVDVLNRPDDSVCYRYDPIGSQRLSEAKNLRRFSKRVHKKIPTEFIFDTPIEIEHLFCNHVHSGEFFRVEPTKCRV